MCDQNENLFSKRHTNKMSTEKKIIAHKTQKSAKLSFLTIIKTICFKTTNIESLPIIKTTVELKQVELRCPKHSRSLKLFKK